VPVFFEEIQIVNARRQLFPQAPTLLLKLGRGAEEDEQP
jgi:hypothetical protein